jgi:phosphatidylethanolamine-binding protein (PEBP) family uncharacterized protein
MFAARTSSSAISGAAAFGLAALALTLSASGALSFTASLKWCSGSPNFELKDVPAGTAKLNFVMTDLDVPSFHHGGGTVAYGGHATVPCGAFTATFLPPSPPRGKVHSYEFTIRALGADGAELATTTAQRKFPDR